jgi:hypothetical protein
MKNPVKILIVAVSALALSGCAMHNGYMKNSAALGEANFSYVDQRISGTASTQQVFLIGGLNKQALVDEARANMLKNNPLKPNQALANITVDWKYTIIVVVTRTECTVTADVVEFK